MFCENCGKQIDPKYNVCMYCGNIISSEDTNATQLGDENIEKLFEKEFEKLNTVQSEAPVQKTFSNIENPIQKPVQNIPPQQFCTAPATSESFKKKKNSKFVIINIIVSVVFIILLAVSFIIGNITAHKPGFINFNRERPSYVPEDAIEFNGNYYKAYDEFEYTWQNAKAYCESQGGHLVTITSAQENEFIMQLAVKKSYHLGACDNETEGEWKWITGEKWNYTNWDQAEPNNQRNQDYLHIYGFEDSDAGFWDDAHGGELPFICEWEG